MDLWIGREELFYQLGLRQFGRFVRIKLRPAPPLKDLVRLVVEHEEGREAAKIPSEKIVEVSPRPPRRRHNEMLTPRELEQRIYDTLMGSRAMLDEYFSFRLTDDGEIDSLPLILPGYTPNLNKLPLCLFSSPLLPLPPSPLTSPLAALRTVLIRLGVQVDWEDEKNCFETFLRELAFFYVPGPTTAANGDEAATAAEAETQTRQIQHVVFPAAKQYLLPPEGLLKTDFVQVTSLESLYKVCVGKASFCVRGRGGEERREGC